MNQLHHKELSQGDIDLYYFYRQHGIHDGFFQRYFKFLPNETTAAKAFNRANDEYYELFGEYKYSSITSFRNQLKNYLST